MNQDPGNGSVHVAVIGMSGRFPGAGDVESFWRMICDGREGIRDFDDAELRRHGAVDEDLRHPRFVRTGAPLDDPDLFDARFFGVNPRDAELMDPQHRLMLEVAHAALEDAGYGDPSSRPVTGVFVGSSMSHYAFHIYSHGQMRGPMASLQAQIGNGESHLATRISYKLDLRGPCMFVQTACSTSLTAIHLACRSLLAFDCDLALAGGSSLTMPFPSGYVHMEGGMLSADGRCRSFDADASGTVIGNGAGAVILKRLDDALRDGDTIHAVVIGSAVNNDGADKVGYTAPGGDGQTAVITQALGIAGVPADSVGLIEAHGTGTFIGDPLEVQSLARVYRGAPGSCWLGSVKSNVGHMLAAAGVAGFIKAVLAVERRQIPPSAGFRRPNPHIDFAATPFRVADALREWPAGDGPRRAAISSFGIGGSNAHLLLEQAPAVTRGGPAQAQLLPVSAATPAALSDGLRALAQRLSTEPPDLADVAWTLQQGRQAFALRTAVVARTAAGAAVSLEALADAPAPAPAGSGKLAWVFPGQGAQRVRMFEALYRQPGEFRRVFAACAEVYARETGRDLVERVMSGTHDEALVATEWAQPALFAVEVALGRQWMAWGVRPDMLLGHSVGELAAACLAGVFSEADGMRAVIVRGREMQRQPPGAMLAIVLPAEEARKLFVPGVVIAAVNAPRRCVAAGSLQAILSLQERMAARQVMCQRLSVSHAFHSPAMQAAADALTEFMGKLPLRPPTLPIVSSASGRWLADDQATDPAYWGRQVMQPVVFLEGLRTLAAEEPGVLLEVGPGAALGGFAVGVLPSSARILASDAAPRRTEDEEHYLELLGQMWCAGVPVGWQGLHQDQPRRRVPLPSYRFDRQRFWIEPRAAALALPAAPATAEAQRAEDVGDWFYLPSWRRTLAVAALPAQAACWLLFIDDQPLGGQIARRLRALGHRVVTVRPGPALAFETEDEITLSPDAAEHHDRLLAHLVEAGHVPQQIVHAWGLGPRRDGTAERVACFDSLIALAQAIGRVIPSAPLSLSVLAEGVQRVGADDAVVPERALAIGPAKVAGQEFAQLRARHVDVVQAQWRGEAGLDRLIAELAAWEPAGPGSRPRDQAGIVALRGPDRWIQTFEKVVLPASTPALRAGGVYLVTGGLGGIGLVLAECLAAHGARTLVLTTRRLPAVDARAQRPREAALARMRELGCEPRVVELDPADASALRSLLGALAAEFGRIDGIVHAAGAPGAGMIQLKQPSVAHAVLRPKYDAVLALEQALGDDIELGFLVHCSSLSSVRGGFGQVDYCAANAFLDAHAQSGRSPRIGRVLSINWGAWAEAGMAVAAIQRHGFLPCPFWLRQADGAGEPLAHPWLERLVHSPDGEQAIRVRLRPSSDWILDEHRLHGVPTMPGTGYLELLRAAWAALHGPGPVEIRDVEFRQAVSASGHDTVELYVMVERTEAGCDMRIVTRTAGAGGAEVLTDHVRASLRRPPAPVEARRIDVAGLRRTLHETAAEQEPATAGALSFGPHWQLPGRRRSGPGQGLAEVAFPQALASELDTYRLHPSLLDVALGAARLAVGTGQAMLPFGYGRIRVAEQPLPRELVCHATLSPSSSATTAVLDAVIADETGAVLVEIEGYRLRAVEAAAPGAAADAQAEQARQQATSALAGAILSREGADAFLRALACSARQLVVSPLDLDAVVAKWQSDAQSVVHRVAKADLPRPVCSAQLAAGDAPRGEVEQRIAQVWTELLGYPDVGRDADFFAMGGDSLLGIQLHGRLQDAFGVKLTLAAVFENPSVAHLAALVERARQPGAEAPAAVAPLQAGHDASIDQLLQELG